CFVAIDRDVAEGEGRADTQFGGLMRLILTIVMALAFGAAAALAQTNVEQIVAEKVQPIVPADGAGGVAVAVRIDGKTVFFNFGFIWSPHRFRHTRHVTRKIGSQAPQRDTEWR